MLVLLATLRATLACDPIQPGLYAEKPVGWTADGRYFAWKGAHVQGEEGDERPVFGVVDTRTDRTEVMSPASFEAWQKGHALSPPNASARCGEAELVARVEALGGFEPEVATLTDGALSLPYQGAERLMTLGVVQGGTEWIQVEIGSDWRLLGMAARPAWSPDCRLVAWVLAGYPPSDAATGPWLPDRTVVVRPAGPLIHIMAHGSAPQTVDPIYDALRGAGFAPHVGPKAMKDREATVVYTSGPAKAVAEKVAAAIPGGATVEPLTWATPADLVVAAGRSVTP
jgi:hypothetical protein